MVFLTENDEKKYKQSFSQMLKIEPVRKLEDLVTFDGQVELS